MVGKGNYPKTALFHVRELLSCIEINEPLLNLLVARGSMIW